MTSMELITNIRTELRVFIDRASSIKSEQKGAAGDQTPPRAKPADESSPPSTSSTGQEEDSDEDSAREPTPVPSVSEAGKKSPDDDASSDAGSTMPRPEAASSKMKSSSKNDDAIVESKQRTLGGAPRGNVPLVGQLGSGTAAAPPSPENTKPKDITRDGMPMCRVVLVSMFAFVLGGASLAIILLSLSSEMGILGGLMKSSVTPGIGPAAGDGAKEHSLLFGSAASSHFNYEDNGSAQPSNSQTVSEVSRPPGNSDPGLVPDKKSTRARGASSAAQPSTATLLPSQRDQVDPADSEPLPPVVQRDILSVHGSKAGPQTALRHVPFYYYDFGGASDPATTALTCHEAGSESPSAQLACASSGDALRRKPRHITSLLVVDPGATLTLSVASESRRACPAGPDRQQLQSVLWCVRTVMSQNENQIVVVVVVVVSKKPLYFFSSLRLARATPVDVTFSTGMLEILLCKSQTGRF